MRLLGRYDFILLSGLVLAGTVMFARPLTAFFQIVRDFERDHNLALAPALVILALTLAIHDRIRRRDLKARVAAAGADARQARERTRELERMIAFWQALTQAGDLDALRDVLQEHLPHLTGQDDTWVMIRTDGHWEALLGASQGSADELASWREGVAIRALTESDARSAVDGIDREGQICFPLIAEGETIGMLGLSKGQALLGERRRRLVGAGASLVAVAVRAAQVQRQVRETAIRDPLTGSYRPARALELTDAELRRARRLGLPASVVAFDVDRLGEVNERFGRVCGDAVLAAIGRRLPELLRGCDLRCRQGDDEFVLLLRDTPLEGARAIAEVLRRDLAATAVQWDSDVVSVTASFGVTAARPGEVDPRAVIDRARAACQRAFVQGGNRVEVSGAPLAAV